MKKYILSVIAVLMLGAPAVGLAQVNDNDDIVQLNNLTITSITSLSSIQGASVITAQSPGIACLKYFDARASAGFAYPCPASQVYQIRAQASTVLLLRTRARATINDFAIGDHINVYGFLDASSGVNVDALIVRDLDKPVVGGYYTQFNTLEVQSAPGPYRPSTFKVSGPQGGYQITVTAQTSVLDRNRRLLPLAEIAAGDKVNVYGLYNPAAQSFVAAVLRDLSRPGVTPPPPVGGLSYSLTTDSNVYSVDQPITATLTAYNNSSQSQTLQFNSGCQAAYVINPVGYDSTAGQACTLSLTAVTIPAYSTHVWTLVHQPYSYRLNPGSYTLTARVIGYGSATTNFTVGGGSSGTTQPVITSVGGPTSLQVNQTGTWTISAYGNQNSQLTYYVTWGDEQMYGNAAMAPQQQNYIQTGTFTHSYGLSGMYTVTFTVRDQFGQSATSTLTVNVGAGGTIAPTLNSLSPSYGPVGTFVTAYGSGFPSTGNSVYLNGYAAITNVTSYDGHTLSFTIPQYLSPNCASGMYCPQYMVSVVPGVYQISINNGSMLSNSVTFVVQ